MPRNLHSVIFQGMPGWTLKAFCQVSARILEFVPDTEIRVYLTGDAPSPTTDDPQVVAGHQDAIAWTMKQLSNGKYKVFRTAATLEDMEQCAVWCYPTHLPQPQDGLLAY